MSQASHEFRGSVDFNQHELRNATFQNLITPPIGPKQGQIYFNSTTDLKSPFYWDSTEWIPFGLKPVHKKYVDEASMLAGQALQVKYYIYYRSDEDIYYEYLGTTTGIFEDDYNPIGGSGVTNNKVKVIYIDPNNLSGTGTIEEQICEYINDNITIDYSRHYSKVNIILGIDPNIPPVPLKTIVYGYLYSAAVTSDSRKISSSDDWIVPLRGISPDGGWSQFFNVDVISTNGDVTNIKDTTPDIWNSLDPSHDNSRGLKLRPNGYRDTSGFFELGDSVHLSYNSSPSDFATDGIYIDGSSTLTSIVTPGNPSFAKSIRLVKNSTSLSPGETGTYVGNDGQIYNTICIETDEGNQEWLTENLIETQFRNGDPIPEITNQTEWNTETGWSNENPARCSYDNDESNAFIIE